MTPRAFRRIRLAAAILCSATLAIELAPAASAGTPRCFGRPATIVGTAHADEIAGTNRGDVIVGLGGPDTIDGGGGPDLVCAGSGEDVVFGGPGDDRIRGDRGGFDAIVPGPGDDVVDGGPGADDAVAFLASPAGVDASLADGVATGEGSDTLMRVESVAGSAHDDMLEGGGGDDQLVGMAGNDALIGLGGFDLFWPGAGDDVVDGGDGFDFLHCYFEDGPILSPEPFPGPVTVDLGAGLATGNGTDALASIEGASGSLGDDVMLGDAGPNQFTLLNEGDDTVLAGDGDDVVDGGTGADDLDGGAGEDYLGFVDSPSGMTVDLAAALDSDGDALAGFEHVFGSLHDDDITGDDGPNVVFGLGGDDTLAGLGGDDTLVGQGGLDAADGGAGTDACAAESETACEVDPEMLARFLRIRASGYAGARR
jgi:Ca2+-binding RTX toxin-like protein